MAIVLIFLGCFLLYAKSKHFPKRMEHWALQLKSKPVRTRIFGYTLFVASFTILSLQFGFATGIVIFIMAVLLALSLTIMLLPLHRKYAYILAGLSVLVIVVENML